MDGPAARGSCPAPGGRTETLVHGGRRRAYHLHVPAGHDCATPAPVVFGFHGFASGAAEFAATSRITDRAEREGFVAVHPEGTSGAPAGVQGWNAGRCCGGAAQAGVDDVGFVRTLLGDLGRRMAIDHRRVYATGMSNGGSFVHRLACEAADVFAAVTAVAGTPVVDTCRPTRPVSVLHVHGTADALVPYAGGGPFAFPSVDETIDAWAARDACGGAREIDGARGAAKVSRVAGCPAGIAVRLCAIDGGGHVWPGGTHDPAGAVSATDLAWAFFAAHPTP